MKKLMKTILITGIILSAYTTPAYALSRLGSQGIEVTNIQTRLKAWGYYNAYIDGIYGTNTQSAVMKFQVTHSLTPDGIAGAATLAKIGLPTGATVSSNSTSGNINLLARVINGEARGENYEGQVAVGAVILNRVRHSSFPNTISGVVYQNGAFTAVSDGQIDKPIEDSCYSAARDALNGWDPTGGAIYYYNPTTATNQWIRSRRIVRTIGKHVFCK